MKTKLLLLFGAFFLLTAFTTKIFTPKNHLAFTTFDIGYFTTGGNQYHAIGDGAGHVSALYTSVNYVQGAAVYSFSGTYTTSHNINVSFKRTSSSSTVTYAGLCDF